MEVASSRMGSFLFYNQKLTVVVKKYLFFINIWSLKAFKRNCDKLYLFNRIFSKYGKDKLWGTYFTLSSIFIEKQKCY